MVHGRQSVTDLNPRVSRACAGGRRGEPTVRGHSVHTVHTVCTQCARTHSAGTGWSMRLEPIVENKHNTHALPDWPLRVQAREIVHNLLGYIFFSFSKSSSWLYNINGCT